MPPALDVSGFNTTVPSGAQGPGADPESSAGGGGGGELWRARERKPIWGSGGLPLVGSRGKAPGQGVRGTKSP